jgi:hypothetical protein
MVRAEVAGYPTPLMSPELGCAQLSSFTSLRRVPGHLGSLRRGFATVEAPTLLGSGWDGGLRSEVKGEGRAQPDPEDMSGAECRAVLIPRAFIGEVDVTRSH